MESKLMFLVVCVIGCAVSQADGNLSTPTNLTSKITRTDCGNTKLCLDKPKGCDPSGSSECFFTSVTLTNISVTVELSGSSTGYIALAAGLTSNMSENHNIIFVCGNNNGIFFFTSMLHINTLEIANTPNVSSIQGLMQPSLIQCVFSIPIDTDIIFLLNNVSGIHFNISNIANSQIPTFLDIWKDSTNGTVLGAPTSVFESSVLVNLANVRSTDVVSNATSTTANTTAGTTANSTAGTTANTTANTTAGTTANSTAGTTANSTAGITANTTANSTVGTTANSTAGTTAGTTAKTTTGTTAHSNASISLTSQLSYAAICILGIFLQLI